MSRESSPEEGELLEDGELPDPEQVDQPAHRRNNSKSVSAIDTRHGGPRHQSEAYRTKYAKKDPKASSVANRSREKEKETRSDRAKEAKLLRSKGEAQKLLQLSTQLTIACAKRDTSKHILDLEECLDRVLRLSHAHEKDEDPELSKSISDILDKVFTGVQALHTMSNTSVGKEIVGNKSAIRVVQQTHKHLMLLAPQKQKAFTRWCESKVFGILWRGGTPQSADDEEEVVTQADVDERTELHIKDMKLQVLKREEGLAKDRASLPKPITLPPPTAAGPKKLPAVAPRVPPPRPPITLPLPSAVTPASSLPEPAPPRINPQPPLVPPLAPLPARPPAALPRPPAGDPPKRKRVRRKQQPSPPTNPPSNDLPEWKPLIAAGPIRLRPPAHLQRPLPSSVPDQLPPIVDDEPDLPQRFKSFAITKAPEKKKLLRPINDADSLSAENSDTQEDSKPNAPSAEPLVEASKSFGSASKAKDPVQSRQKLDSFKPSFLKSPAPRDPPQPAAPPASSGSPAALPGPPAALPGPPTALPAPPAPPSSLPAAPSGHPAASRPASTSKHASHLAPTGTYPPKQKISPSASIPDTSKRKKGGQSEAVPGLDTGSILEVFEERANKKQKRTDVSAKKEMSLEEEVEFFRGGANPQISQATLGAGRAFASPEVSPFGFPAAALPPGIGGDSVAGALYKAADTSKPTRVKKEAVKLQQPWDLEFDAESDRLYGALKTSTSNPSSVKDSTPPPPPPPSPSPPPSPTPSGVQSVPKDTLPAPPEAPAAPPRTQSRSQTPDIKIEASEEARVEKEERKGPVALVEATVASRLDPQGQAESTSPIKDANKEVLRYLRMGKLCLVLDLDHTLLNSARWGEVAPKDAQKLEDIMKREENLPAKNLFSIDEIQMWTKLRPHCREFLRTLSRKFVMWIHTNGNRQYAETVRQILDPTRELFEERVVANAGHTSSARLVNQDLMKKLDAEGLKGLDPISVIIDDTAAVWLEHTPNLVVIERYTYFPSSTRQFNLNRPSMLETDRDERVDQGQLAVIQKILLETHDMMLRQFHLAQQGKESRLQGGEGFPSWDVRSVLAHRRAQVLRGCHLLFSRIWHVGMKNEEQHFWVLAAGLGATCTTTTSDEVTHLVTNTTLTEKARWAMKHGKTIVSPQWLEASAILWQKAHESAFQMK